jgi:Ca-activated chloride channel homolog
MMKLSVTVALTAAFAAVALAQDAPRQFRGSVLTVPIYATVIDPTGRLVPDLTQADFEVFDNNKPIPISSFDASVQPVSVVVAVDLSGSMTLVIDLAKDAAETFCVRLLPLDRARIVGFDDKVRFSPQFTSDRDALIRYIRSDMQFGNGTHLWDALYASIDALKSEASRKVVLTLSDGDDYGSNLGDGDVLDSAQRNDVMIYGVGLRNRYRGGVNGAWVTSAPDKNLKRLTQHTGGGYFELTRATELNTTFTRVADELHRQYLIGVSPAVMDGKTHLLDVRAKLPGMTVRARKSYVAAPPK